MGYGSRRCQLGKWQAKNKEKRVWKRRRNRKNILEKTTGLGLRTSEEGKVRRGKKNTRGRDATGVFGQAGHTHLDRMFRKH